MEENKPTKRRRGWLTFAFVLLPLGLAALWCAFIDQEAFGAFFLGVLFTVLFGAMAFMRFLVKKSEHKHPLVGALIIFGCTIAGIVVLFITGFAGTMAIFGDSDEASWGFTLCFMIVAPIALLTGLILAIMKLVKHRRCRNLEDETGPA